MRLLSVLKPLLLTFFALSLVWLLFYFETLFNIGCKELFPPHAYIGEPYPQGPGSLGRTLLSLLQGR